MRADFTPIEELDTAAATRAKVGKVPYSVRRVGREALRLWIRPLGRYLAKSTPPLGFEQVLRRLDREQLAFLALRAVLDRIHAGWGLRKGKHGRERRVKNPCMLFCLELGKAVRDELEFAGLLAAKQYVRAARKRHAALGRLKFRRVEWTPSECARIGDWLWGCLKEMSCFDVDQRGYPKLRADHKAAMDELAEAVLYDHLKGEGAPQRR
jgi:hypothetical protein